MEIAIKTILTAVTGGVIWEGFKFFYPEMKRVIGARKTANDAFYKNLDPILKSASELYGKLESLAKEDFATYFDPTKSIAADVTQNKRYIYYLFAQFWAQLENLRVESQYTSLSRIKKGKELLRFIETVESRKYRILDRSVQRMIGESLIAQKDQRFRVMTLNDFVQNYQDVASPLHRLLADLEGVLTDTKNKESRQKILKFGVIVVALVDHFDPKYKTVRKRAIYINKLSEKSKKSIRTTLLGHYLPFVRKKERYYKQ